MIHFRIYTWIRDRETTALLVLGPQHIYLSVRLRQDDRTALWAVADLSPCKEGRIEPYILGIQTADCPKCGRWKVVTPVRP